LSARSPTIASRATIRGRFHRVRLNGGVWDAERSDPDSRETITLVADRKPIAVLAAA